MGAEPQYRFRCATPGFSMPRVPSQTSAAGCAGRDIIGLAQTGSGKTAAFALPILHTLLDKPQPIYAIVMSPTRQRRGAALPDSAGLGYSRRARCRKPTLCRELAVQIAEQFEALGATIGSQPFAAHGGARTMSFAPSPVDPERSRKWPAAAGLKTAVIVGGIDMMTQAGLPVLHMLTHACNVLRRSGTATCTWPCARRRAGSFPPAVARAQAVMLAKKPHVIVGTPGRVIDHLESTKGFSLRKATSAQDSATSAQDSAPRLTPCLPRCAAWPTADARLSHTYHFVRHSIRAL